MVVNLRRSATGHEESTGEMPSKIRASFRGCIADSEPAETFRWARGILTNRLPRTKGNRYATPSTLFRRIG